MEQVLGEPPTNFHPNKHNQSCTNHPDLHQGVTILQQHPFHTSTVILALSGFFWRSDHVWKQQESLRSRVEEYKYPRRRVRFTGQQDLFQPDGQREPRTSVAADRCQNVARIWLCTSAYKNAVCLCHTRPTSPSNIQTISNICEHIWTKNFLKCELTNVEKFLILSLVIL